MKIGDIAALAGVSTKTIRFYEDIGVLPPAARTSGGHRDYHPEITARLRFIQRCQAAGMSLQQIQDIVAVHERGESPCGPVHTLLSAGLDQVRAKIAELHTLQQHLQTLLDRAQAGPPQDTEGVDVCWILETEPTPPAAGPPGQAGRARRW